MSTTVFLLSSDVSPWTSPLTGTVSVDCIGAGGAVNAAFGAAGRNYGCGGGAWAQNPTYSVTNGSTYPFSVGVSILDGDGQPTSFDSGGVLAAGGQGSISAIFGLGQGGGFGGTTAASTGTNKFRGGNAGYQSGGGGAGGPNGNGGDVNRYASSGGAGDAGFGGAGGAQFAIGGNGAEYTSTLGASAGSGGGAGSGTDSVQNGPITGGLYGGAAGANFGGAGTAGGKGGSGIIVLVYTAGGGGPTRKPYSIAYIF